MLLKAISISWMGFASFTQMGIFKGCFQKWSKGTGLNSSFIDTGSVPESAHLPSESQLSPLQARNRGRKRLNFSPSKNFYLQGPKDEVIQLSSCQANRGQRRVSTPPLHTCLCEQTLVPGTSLSVLKDVQVLQFKRDFLYCYRDNTEFQRKQKRSNSCSQTLYAL